MDVDDLSDPPSPAEPAPTVPPNPDSRNSQIKTVSSSSASSRHSPLTPLAPLEFLQNQRKGSITDPSLHAAPNAHLSAAAFAINKTPSQPPRSPSSLLAGTPLSHDPQATIRPSSAYQFRDPSKEGPNTHIRRLLRSPSAEPGGSAPAYSRDHSAPGSEPGTSKDPAAQTDSEHMDIDSQSSLQTPPGAQERFVSLRQPKNSDYSTRRQSLAGTKRKMSHEKDMLAAGNGDIDPQLVGSGVPGDMNVETEGPAPKRRGSAIDTQRIAQLSLNDRRDSVDTRIGGPPQQWWTERRDSSSTMFPSPSPGYTTPSSAFSGDSPHGRPPGGIATFAWPANPHPDQAPPSMQNETVNMPGPPHFHDPLGMMPPVSFAHDRRMSAPAMSVDSMTTPASGPSRVLRSRSRPPSRARGPEGTNNIDTSINMEDGGAQSSASKESNTTPYSRSPELRVSHKLAERKRRKEMKDLFDELRDQLPADRGMKASKWEILSKAIDFIVTLKTSHQEMGREIEMLRHELDSVRQGIPPFPGAPPPVVYAHGPPVGVPYPPSGPPGPPPPPHPHAQPSPPQHQQSPHSRPPSSQNLYPTAGPAPPQNGTISPPGPARSEPSS